MSKDITLLRIIEAMGGSTQSDDSAPWLAYFCDDDTPDTFNRCHDRGWLTTAHNPDGDSATTMLLPAGRAALDAAKQGEFHIDIAVVRLLTARAQDLIDKVTFDESGALIAGQWRGGNGGLISRETIQSADLLRRELTTVAAAVAAYEAQSKGQD